MGKGSSARTASALRRIQRAVLAIVVAAVVLYVWGFLVWGVVPYPAVIWKQPVDEEAARKALREQFPEPGTYVVPRAGHDEATKEAPFKQGPVAMPCGGRFRGSGNSIRPDTISRSG